MLLGGRQMKRRSLLLLRALALGGLLALLPGPTAAYIDYPPPTLGALCMKSHHVYVLRVEKTIPEKGALLFACVERLKGQPDETVTRHVVRPKVEGAKIILDGAVRGKTAVLFTLTGGTPGRDSPGVGNVYLDGYWYSVIYERGARCWVANRGVPELLTRYCGTAGKLRDAVADILAGKEVVVPCMVNDRKEDVVARRAKVQRLRASLRIRDYD